jgi:predicted dehydrogenase
MINVGIAGIGFMGMIHYLAYRKLAGAQVAAISTRNEQRLAGDWTDIKGNFGPQGEVMDLAGVARYSQLDDMIADPDIQLIDICLPPHLHAAATIKALEAGKHVLCEKPIALQAVDAERMVETARRCDRQLTIGHVLPFFPEFDFVRSAVQRGDYGRLLGGRFHRLISDPLWLDDFYDPQRAGGPMLDLHVHDAHFIRLLFGVPESVHTVGRMRGEVAEYFTSQFRFSDPEVVVSAESGTNRQQGRAFTHGFEIHLERATLLHDFAVIGDQPKLLMPVTVLTDSGDVIEPEIATQDPVDSFVGELDEVTRCIQEGRESQILSGELARDALLMCHKQNESLLAGTSASFS